VDSPHPKGDTNMSVQMIELEEVQVIDTSDDALEKDAGSSLEAGSVGCSHVNSCFSCW
jgi:hypothetical protein